VRFFRRHSETVLVALLALCLQWTASFGHVHTLRAPSPDLAVQCRTIFKPSDELPCPKSDRGEAHCTICWSMAQANAAAVPAPPALALPPAASISHAPLTRVAHVGTVATSSFEARGPPLLG